MYLVSVAAIRICLSHQKEQDDLLGAVYIAQYYEYDSEHGV